MTFFHIDAITAASAESQTVGWEWTDSTPFGSVDVDAGGNGFFGVAELRIYGEGETNIGKYIGFEDGFEIFNLNWINPLKTSQVPNYFLRLTNLQTADGPTFPGTLYTYSGVWSNGRTEWRSLAIASPHNGIVSDTSALFGAQAQGEFGEPYFEENLWGNIELGKLVGPIESFDAADVDTGNDEIVLTGHVFETGDEVVYIENGTAPSPLVNNTVYAVRKITNDRISLGTSLGNINATPNFIDLTSIGVGTGHTFQRIDSVATALIQVEASI